MNNHKNTAFHQFDYLLKTNLKPTKADSKEMDNLAKFGILLIIHNYTKVSRL